MARRQPPLLEWRTGPHGCEPCNGPKPIGRFLRMQAAPYPRGTNKVVARMPVSNHIACRKEVNGNAS